MRHGRRLLGLALGLAALALLLAWLLRPAQVRVELARVERGPFVQAVQEEGKTRVRDRYVVNAPLAGYLERSRVKAGEPVEVGALLATVRPAVPALLDARTWSELGQRAGAAAATHRRALAAVRQAEAALRFAKSERARTLTLVARGVLPQRERDRTELELQTATRALEVAQAEAHAAEHAHAEARTALLGGPTGPGAQRRWELRSPVRGRVLRVVRESEGFVAPGEPLFELGDPQQLEVVVDVLTADAVAIRPGNPVELQQWGGGQGLRGVVRLVEPSGVTRVSALGVEEQRVDVTVALTSPREQWQSLGDGYRVEARILVREDADVVKAPSGALFREAQGWAVFVVEQGRARRRSVQVAADNGLEFSVAHGLVPGEQLVLFPGEVVQEGTRVRAR